MDSFVQLQTSRYNTLHEILREKSYEEKVRPVIAERNSENSKVYVGNHVVIARFLKPKHAEYRVLQKLEQLSQNFLLLYSYLSPCSTCTDINDNNNILKQIDMYIHKWTDNAVVFTKVYDKSNSETQSAVDVSTHTPIDRGEMAESRLELAWSLGSLRNIFRCDKMSNSELECHSCCTDGRYSEFCINNNVSPQQAGNHRRERSQSESSRVERRWGNRSSSGRRPNRKNMGGGSSRKRSKHSSKRRSRGGSTWGSRGRSSSKNRGGGCRRSSSSKGSRS